MTQGYVSSEVFSLQNNSSDLVNSMAHALKGAVVESYGDVNTLSSSLASSEFKSSIMSGNQKVNLQNALHQEFITGLWRLTVGTPIITMEY
ncbi:TATA-box binding [Paenibacillus sp. yr247]|nr:TATA-box binding [Paenibacillus sp. yr247]